MNIVKYISATVLGVVFIAAGVISPYTAAAQSADDDCEMPDFNITSSSDIFAIAGDDFSYFVVTDSSISYSIDSGLPSGLSFSNGQITGVPSESSVGDHEIIFSASNDCGTATESISLTVLSGDSGTAAATSDDDTGQTAASGESVALNDIPETGIVADTALTVMFYLLALLLVAGWFGRRLQYASVSGSDSGDMSSINVIPSLERRYTSMVTRMNKKKSTGKRKRFGDGIRR